MFRMDPDLNKGRVKGGEANHSWDSSEEPPLPARKVSIHSKSSKQKSKVDIEEEEVIISH